MADCPDIVTYQSTDDFTPVPMVFAAAMIPTKEPGSHWMAYGPTAEAARGKLEAMWAKEHPTRSGAPKKGAARPVEVDADDPIL